MTTQVHSRETAEATSPASDVHGVQPQPGSDSVASSVDDSTSTAAIDQPKAVKKTVADVVSASHLEMSRHTQELVASDKKAANMARRSARRQLMAELRQQEREARKARQRENFSDRGQRPMMIAIFVGVAIATGLSAASMTQVGIDVLRLPVAVAIMFSSFLEVLLVQCALAARAAILQRKSRIARNITLNLTWLFATLSGVFASWHAIINPAHSAWTMLEAGIRFSIPIAAALGWHVMLIMEREEVDSQETGVSHRERLMYRARLAATKQALKVAQMQAKGARFRLGYATWLMKQFYFQSLKLDPSRDDVLKMVDVVAEVMLLPERAAQRANLIARGSNSSQEVTPVAEPVVEQINTQPETSVTIATTAATENSTTETIQTIELTAAEPDDQPTVILQQKVQDRLPTSPQSPDKEAAKCPDSVGIPLATSLLRKKADATADELQSMILKDGWKPPSVSTLKRWLNKARDTLAHESRFSLVKGKAS